MKGLNKDILRLSIPSILANITVPIVGMVDTAVAGHLQGADGAGAATFIGAISVGSMLFSLLYWNFSFLRTGTGGLTAQAFGRGDMHDSATIFARGISLAGIMSLLVLALQWPFAKAAILVTQGSAEVESLALRYFFIRVWAAPATISLMTFRGWFVGMQDSVSSMWTDLIVNIVNIAASVLLTFGCFGWSGIGFDGVALGTVIAQYCGLSFCILTCRFRYRKVLGTFRLSELPAVLERSKLREFMKMNLDLLGRSLAFTGIYIGYTMLAATLGDLMLACSSIMMQLLMLFSYFTDGFAYAGEALTGRFIGAQDLQATRRTVKYIFIWSMSIATAFIGIYMSAGVPLLRLLTSDAAVIDACREYLPWLILMPPLGCAAFTWDGIFLGATASRPMRDTMLVSMAGFFAVWFIFRKAAPLPGSGMHLLMAAYFIHLVIRTIGLSLSYRKNVLSRF